MSSQRKKREGKTLYGGYLDKRKCDLLDQVATSKKIETRTDFLNWIADVIAQSQVSERELGDDHIDEAKDALAWLNEKIQSNPTLQTSIIYYCRSLGWLPGNGKIEDEPEKQKE